MAAKKSSKVVNKTKYITSLPKEMSAKEVVEKGKADGISLTTSYVYTVRNNASKATRPQVAKKIGRPAGSANKTAAASPPRTSGHEGELYRLIERIVEEKVRTVLNARFGALLK